jgi:hypothetical protein
MSRVQPCGTSLWIDPLYVSPRGPTTPSAISTSRSLPPAGFLFGPLVKPRPCASLLRVATPARPSHTPRTFSSCLPPRQSPLTVFLARSQPRHPSPLLSPLRMATGSETPVSQDGSSRGGAWPRSWATLKVRRSRSCRPSCRPPAHRLATLPLASCFLGGDDSRP